MKKVVILHPAYWRQAMGGAELQISYLINSLRLRNYEIHYIYVDKGVEFVEREKIILHGISVVKFNKKAGQFWFVYLFKINRLLKKIKPDIIYTRFFSSWGWVASFYASKFGSKHIWALASDSDVEKKVNIYKPLDLIEGMLVKRGLIKANTIFAQNEYQMIKLSYYFHIRGVLIPQMAPLVEERIITKKRNPIKVLWVANLKKLKRPELFINLADNFKNNKEYLFIMLGKMGKGFENIVGKAAGEINNFKYMGEQHNTIVNELLCEADILVNTSDYEGFSNTFVQAWMRKVVVISMNSNPNSILTDKKIGFLCPSINEISEKIRFLKKNIKIMDEMGKKAYNYAVESHSIEKNMEKALKYFN